MYLVFDTETTGLPKNFNAPISDLDNWPRCIQIAWQLHDEMGNLIEHKDYLIKPDDFDIPYDSERIHGISTELATQKGVDIKQALNEFVEGFLRKGCYQVSLLALYTLLLRDEYCHTFAASTLRPSIEGGVLPQC